MSLLKCPGCGCTDRTKLVEKGGGSYFCKICYKTFSVCGDDEITPSCAGTRDLVSEYLGKKTGYADRPAQSFDGKEFSNGFSKLYAELLPSIVKVVSPFKGIGGYCGTGFIIKGGFIATNAHVVVAKDDSGNIVCPESYKLTFSPTVSEREYTAKLYCYEFDQDIAILKCVSDNDFEKLALTLGDSDKIMPGEDAFTIGNGKDYGLAFTKLSIAQSPVSGRRFGDYDEIIQLVGNTQPGNSGGPLFNAAGEVTGIITFHPTDRNEILATLPTTDGKLAITKQVVETTVDGVRFAVTVNTLKRVAAKAGINL